MASNARPAVLVGLRVEAKERPKKGVVMSRSRSRHKKEKKRRHDRQIAEGTRVPTPKVRKARSRYTPRGMVRLSELNPDDVRKVLDVVKNLQLYP